jgi:oligopeptide transport system permease protein
MPATERGGNMAIPEHDLFRPLLPEERIIYETKTETVAFWSEVWRRFRKNKPAMAGVAIISLFVVLAIVGPAMVPYRFDKVDLLSSYQPPNAKHWFGTDGLGRDLWARTWVGARVSLYIGVAAALCQMVIGILIGAFSGIYGGRVDMLIMRFVDILIAIPFLIWVSLFMLLLKPGIGSIIVSFSLTQWSGMARLVRGEVLRLKNSEFVLATQHMGASRWRIIFKHLFPNFLPVVIVNTTFRVTGAIFGESFLSFIGLGIQPPMTSWGVLIANGISEMREHTYLLIFPAVCISLTMLSLQLIGDGLRDAIDPKLRQ